MKILLCIIIWHFFAAASAIIPICNLSDSNDCDLKFNNVVFTQNEIVKSVEYKRNGNSSTALNQISNLTIQDQAMYYMPKFFCLNQTEKLSIKRCGLTQLHGSDLINFPKLNHLDLSNNLIEMLEEDLFSNNQKIKTLLLSGNRIKFIHENAFEPLHSIEYLDLTRNLCISKMGKYRVAAKNIIKDASKVCSYNDTFNAIMMLKRDFNNNQGTFQNLENKIETSNEANQNYSIGLRNHLDRNISDIINLSKTIYSKIETIEKNSKSINQIDLQQQLTDLQKDLKKVLGKNFSSATSTNEIYSSSSLGINVDDNLFFIGIISLLTIINLIISVSCLCLKSKQKIPNVTEPAKKSENVPSIAENVDKIENGIQNNIETLEFDDFTYEELPCDKARNDLQDYAEVQNESIHDLPMYATVDMAKKIRK